MKGYEVESLDRFLRCSEKDSISSVGMDKFKPERKFIVPLNEKSEKKKGKLKMMDRWWDEASFEMKREIIQRFVKKRAIEPLIGLLDDPSPSIRSIIIVALGKLGDKKLFDRLIPCLGDPSPEVRAEVVRVLGILGGVNAANYLIEHIDPEASLKWRETENIVINQTLRTLGQLKDLRAYNILVFWLSQTSYTHVRGEAAKALAELGGTRALDAMLKCVVELTERITFSIIEQRAVIDAVLKLAEDKPVETFPVLEAFIRKNARWFQTYLRKEPVIWEKEFYYYEIGEFFQEIQRILDANSDLKTQFNALYELLSELLHYTY